MSVVALFPQDQEQERQEQGVTVTDHNQLQDGETGSRMSPADFLEWFYNAEPGDRCIYFVGYLGGLTHEGTVGRLVLEHAGYEFRRRAHESSAGNPVWQRNGPPLVDLVQKRLGMFQYIYIAQKRRA